MGELKIKKIDDLHYMGRPDPKTALSLDYDTFPHKVVIELPGIQAVSRNKTTGHFIEHHTAREEAEKYINLFGKHYEHHFTKPVKVLIECYIDTVHSYPRLTKSGKVRKQYYRLIDVPNVDDKIFTDILIRYRNKTVGKQVVNGRLVKQVIRDERRVWFIEDDNPAYLVEVSKRCYASDQHKVVITITEVDNGHAS